MDHPQIDMRKWLEEIDCSDERARFAREFGLDEAYFAAQDDHNNAEA